MPGTGGVRRVRAAADAQKPGEPGLTLKTTPVISSFPPELPPSPPHKAKLCGKRQGAPRFRLCSADGEPPRETRAGRSKVRVSAPLVPPHEATWGRRPSTRRQRFSATQSSHGPGSMPSPASRLLRPGQRPLRGWIPRLLDTLPVSLTSLQVTFLTYPSRSEWLPAGP